MPRMGQMLGLKFLWQTTAIAVFLVAIPFAGPSQALPPRVHGSGELLIIDRTATSLDDTAPDARLPNASPPADAEATEQPLLISTGQPAIDSALRTHESSLTQLAPLLVHPLYFTRDLEFQAKSIPRGRYLLVAKDHRCQKARAVDVTLPDGAPIIVHRMHSISYVYPSERIIVDFGRFKPKEPQVHYEKGQGMLRSLRNRTARLATSTRQSLTGLPILAAFDRTGQKALDTAGGVAALHSRAGTTYVDTLNKLIDFVPGVKSLEGLGQQLPERRKLERLRQAGNNAARNVKEFTRTIR